MNIHDALIAIHPHPYWINSQLINECFSSTRVQSHLGIEKVWVLRLIVGKTKLAGVESDNEFLMFFLFRLLLTCELLQKLWRFKYFINALDPKYHRKQRKLNHICQSKMSKVIFHLVQWKSFSLLLLRLSSDLHNFFVLETNEKSIERILVLRNVHSRVVDCGNFFPAVMQR